MAECPFIDRGIEWDGAHLEPVDQDGYLFYRHHNGGSKPKNCQFCKMVGRTCDIWTCANDWQWVRCSHFRENLDQLPEGFSLDDVPALI